MSNADIDILKNWTFTMSGDCPEDVCMTPSVSSVVSGPYEVTTITFGFSGDAEYYTKEFAASFSFDVESEANAYSVSVSSDDNVTVSVGELSVRSELNKPASAETDDWIDEPKKSLSVSGNYENIGGPYSMSVTIVLKRSLRIMRFGFRYAPPTSENPGETSNYPESERRRIGAGESVKIYIKSKEDNGGEMDTPSSVCVSRHGETLYDGQWIESESGGMELSRELLIKGNQAGEIDIEAEFLDGEVLEETLEIVFPTFQIGEEIESERKYSYPTGDDKVAIVGFLTKYKVRVYPLDVSFAGAYFWECVGESYPDGIFKNMEGTSHSPGEELMSLGSENDWEDTVGYGISEFPSNAIGTEEYRNVPDGGEVGVLKWEIPVRWTVLPCGDDKAKSDLENVPNDCRKHIGEISPASLQITKCKRVCKIVSEDDGVWVTEGLSIHAEKNFCPNDLND